MSETSVDWKQKDAIERNVARMTDKELLRELRWLQEQEAQPPIRQALIRELQAEKERRVL